MVNFTTSKNTVKVGF